MHLDLRAATSARMLRIPMPAVAVGSARAALLSRLIRTTAVGSAYATVVPVRESMCMGPSNCM
jgi:hypothetical protein